MPSGSSSLMSIRGTASGGFEGRESVLSALLSDDGTTATGALADPEDGINYSTDFDLIYHRVGT
jgi:hypothetical protein